MHVVVLLRLEQVDVAFGVEALAKGLDEDVGSAQAEDAFLAGRILRVEIFDAPIHHRREIDVDPDGLRELDRLEQGSAKDGAHGTRPMRAGARRQARAGSGVRLRQHVEVRR